MRLRRTSRSKDYLSSLFLYTKMRNVAGLAQTEAQKSSDLFMKCRYMDELTDNHGIIFATGTPISNSMTEMYTMQRYLQYDTLRSQGLQHFDAWASTFGETITAIELAPEGTGYRAKTRFARFYNLPELISMFKQVADVQTADMLKLPIPEAEYHNEVIKPSKFQTDMVASFSERAEKVRNGMSFQAFIRSLKDMGYEVKTGVKHIAVRPPGKEQFVRLRSLGDSYTEEAIKQRILKQRAPERPLKPVPPKIMRIRVQGDFHLSKITWRGLRALYYFYLRKLRAAQKQPQGKASYLLREDLRHLDELDEQSRFLFRHGIDTAEQLTDYRASADAQLKSLYAERKTLHNEQRRHDVPEARMVEIRARIAAISKQAKLLRNELKLCDAITERSLALSKRQEQMKQLQREEAANKQKEQSRERIII